MPDIEKVCFVGAGTMGCYNSLITALTGYQVALYDISQNALDDAPERQRNWAPILAQLGIADFQEIAAASDGILRTANPAEAARNADLLSESVFERLDIKRQTHRHFDALLPAHAIMTTNTSSLLPSEIETTVQRGDKFAAMHFHQPTSLVDIMAGSRTSVETIETLKRFVRSQGQIYIVIKKERQGYLHNAMFGSLLGTAMMLAAVGRFDYKDIDRAWMSSQNKMAGPFGMMDGVGLNVVADTLGENKRTDPGVVLTIRRFLEPYLQRGDLGIKTGRGFYDYPEPEFMQPEFLTGVQTDQTLSDAMIGAVLVTALTLLAEGYADLEDVDRSWMLTHCPACGPFGMMDEIGLDVVKRSLEERAKRIETMMGNPGTIYEMTKTAVGVLAKYIQKGTQGVKSGAGFYRYPDPAYREPDFLGTKRPLRRK